VKRKNIRNTVHASSVLYSIYPPLTHHKLNGNCTFVAQGRYNYRRQEAPLDSAGLAICMSILLRVFSHLELT